MGQLTVRFKYGPEESWKTRKELLNHLEDNDAVAYYAGDLFKERDKYKKVTEKLLEIIELVAEQQAMPDNTYVDRIKETMKILE